MANGFAMRGFTQGLTQGLQNANELYNSYVNRDLARAESGRQERTLRLAEEKSEMDRAKERLAMEQSNKQSQFPVIEAILKKDSLSQDDYKRLMDFGMGPMLNMEDDADTINTLAQGVRSGQIPMDDPEVTKRLLPALTPVFNRNLGDVGRDPKTGAEIRVAAKEPVGFQRVNGKIVPILRVKGANAKGEFAEYDAPATQFASSLPDDPLLALTESEAARKLTGLAKFNRMLSRNPAIRQQAQEFSRSLAYGAPQPMSALDQQKTLNEQDKIRSRQLQDQIKRLEYISSISKGKAQEEAEKALTELRREQVNTEQSKQDKNWAEADSKGLGSAKEKKAPVFKDKPVMDRAKMLFPVENEMPGMPIPDDQRKRRSEYFNAVQGLVNNGGAELDKAMDIAQNGTPVKGLKTKDGRSFDGFKTVIDGKTQYIPYRWN